MQYVNIVSQKLLLANRMGDMNLNNKQISILNPDNTLTA